MRVEKHKVVSFDYSLKSADGDLLDSSEGGEPLEYVHGIGAIIPGLERVLEGRAEGETFDAVIAPEDGYGAREDGLVQQVARDQFEMEGELEVGTQFIAETEVGEHPFVVTAIEGDVVTVDGNHPLAGVALHFQIAVRGVREATAEELEHGHTHPGGDCGGGDDE